MSGRLACHERLRDFGPSLIRQIFDAAGPDAVNLGLGMPDMDVPQAAVEAAVTEVRKARAPYTPNAGWPALRQAVIDAAAAHRGQGALTGDWLHPDGVVITVGAEEALFVALGTLAGPGDEILVPDPGFSAYDMIATVLGCRVRTYELDSAAGFAPTAASIERALGPATRAVILGSPGNPTGAVASAAELEAIATLLDGRGVAWVSDEIYDRFVYDSPFASLSAYSDQGIVVGGVSKSANMMGWRCGWLIAPLSVARAATAVHQAVCSCVAGPSQAAALAICRGLADGGAVADEIARNVATFRQRRNRTVSALANLNLSVPTPGGAFYAFVDLRPLLGDLVDDLAFCRTLVSDHGLVAIPGSAFGDGGRGHIRLAYTTSRLDEGLARLGEGLRR